MTVLLEFPTELLRLVLAHLADIDLASVFISRRTCRLFQVIATDILTKSISQHGLSVHALIQKHFPQLLDSKTAPHQYQPHRKSIRQGEIRYFALLWVSNPEIRAKYLREEASWRQLPVVSPSGDLVHHLQQVEFLEDYPYDIHLEGGRYGVPDWEKAEVFAPDWVDYFFPKGFQLGHLYDQILGVGGEQSVGGWEMLWDSRVREKEFMLLGRDTMWRRVPDLRVEDVSQLFTHEKHHAILLLPGTSPYELEGAFDREDVEKRFQGWWPGRIADFEELWFDRFRFPPP